MVELKVVNIKCDGCEYKIAEKLTQAGFINVRVSASDQTVSFEGDVEKGKKLLNKLGYPEAGSPEAKSLMKKAKSYVSCIIGKSRN